MCRSLVERLHIQCQVLTANLSKSANPSSWGFCGTYLSRDQASADGSRRKGFIRRMTEKIVFQIPPGTIEAIEAFRKNAPDLKSISIPKIDTSQLEKIRKDATAIFPAFQQQFELYAPQLAELQRTMHRTELVPQHVVKQLGEATKTWQSTFAKIPPLTAEFQRVVEQIAITERRKRALGRIGLLPHASTPFTMLDSEIDDETLKATLETYYRDEWCKISASIVKRSQNFAIDDEAKAAFAEGLQAHENGHYRSVCRLLLLEIERVARVELAGNEVGTLHVDKLIGEPAGDLGLSQTNPPGYLAIGLYQCLTEHLYKHVNASNRVAFENDPVPNRHAAVHGLIVYNSFWHSLNVIFMTDYAFQIVTALADTGRNVP